MKTINYGGYECCALENDSLKLLVTQSIGPRVISFGFEDGTNLFAELPDFVTELPQGGVFHFYGGHRLWQAPEKFDTTYIPDDAPVEITSIANGLSVTQPLQSNGLQKSLQIVLTGEAQVQITHRITNHQLHPITLAPWAITQFKTDGVAILPQAGHEAGILPNRSMALWSYTDMSSPHVTWGKDYVLVSAQMETPFKIGFSNPCGWLAYWLDDTLFVKHAEYKAGAEYYDFGSSSECYCNDKFLELETLGSIVTLNTKEATTHVETWDLYKDIERPQNEAAAKTLVARLGLD